jgi:hypothetical protein
MTETPPGILRIADFKASSSATCGKDCLCGAMVRSSEFLKARFMRVHSFAVSFMMADLRMENALVSSKEHPSLRGKPDRFFNHHKIYRLYYFSMRDEFRQTWMLPECSHTK